MSTINIHKPQLSPIVGVLNHLSHPGSPTLFQSFLSSLDSSFVDSRPPMISSAEPAQAKQSLHWSLQGPLWGRNPVKKSGSPPVERLRMDISMEFIF